MDTTTHHVSASIERGQSTLVRKYQHASPMNASAKENYY